MGWDGRPRSEGRGLRGRSRAWTYAKKGLQQPSKNDAFQTGTTSYSDKSRYNGTNRVTNGLVCEWWFDEGSGTEIIDRTPLTKESPLAWVYNPSEGLDGEWSQDSGQNDRYYLNLSAGGATRNFTSTEFLDNPIQNHEISVEAWFKPSNQVGLNTSGPGRIFTLTPSNTTYTDQCVMLGHGTWTGNASNHNSRSYAARVKMYGTTHQLWSADDTAVTDQLVHLVVTAKYNTEEKRAEARFYVDGVLVDSKNVYDNSHEIFDLWDTDARVSTGSARDGEKKAKGGYYLTAVYDRALTAAEVTQNFEEGVSPQSGGYKKGTRAVLNDGASTLDAGKADKFEVSLSGGVHLDKLTVTLTASSDDAGMTLGEDFTLTPTSVDLPKGTYTKSVSLSCAADTSADHTINVFVNSISNNGGTTVVVNPFEDADDSFDTAVTAKGVKPDLKFQFDTDPQTIPSPTAAVIDGFIVSKTRDYDESVEFTVSGTATPANTADYYFWSGGAPGVFSAPFLPISGTNCGFNNEIWQQTYGSPVTLSAWGGDGGDTGKITTDGLLVENAIVNGVLNVRANDVTFRNCLIQGAVVGTLPPQYADYGLNFANDFTGLTVEDCSFERFDSAGFYGAFATLRRCSFYETNGDLLKSYGGVGRGHVTVESCHFQRMGNKDYFPAAHADAWQHRGPGSNLICRWNNFDIPGYFETPPNRKHSAAIIWQNKNTGLTDPLSGCVIDSNYFNKGGSNAILLEGEIGPISDVYIINNKFAGEEDDYNNDDGHVKSNGQPYVGMGWCQYHLLAGGAAGVSYTTFNNKHYDGSEVYRTGSGPANSSPIDNVTAPPDIPFYESPVGDKIDLSTGITLTMGPEDTSKGVLVYSEATDSNGTFVDGDSLSGVLVSGSVTTGADAGDSLSVCSTLSTLTIEFSESGFARDGLGAGSKIPVETGEFETISMPSQDERGNDVVNRTRSPLYENPFGLTSEEALTRIQPAPVGGETDSTTGPRVSVTDHPHHDICWFVDPGQSNASNKIEVPAAGLLVSGYAFEEVRIKTTNPLKFVDCEFSGQTDYHNGIEQQYVVWDNNQGGGPINQKVDFEYCDFRGGASITLMMNFRKLYKCNFNDTIADYIRFRNGNYRITNCWFGSYMKAPDSALNGNSGQYNQNSGVGNPHADPMQNFLTENDIIHVADCTFDQRPATWSDGTTNPDHDNGAYPDKIMQYGGTTANPNPPIGEMRFTNCILNGGGNYMIAASPPAKAAPATFSFKDCKFGTSLRSNHFGTVHSQHTLLDLGGNVWLETGTPGIRLPQEAIDAGTRTTGGRDNLPISYVIRRLDNVNFGQTGMNEGGRTSWGQRGTGWG